MNAFSTGSPEAIDVLVFATLGLEIDPRSAGAPICGVSEIAADVREERRAVQAIALAPRARKRVAIAGLGTKLDEQVSRRNPLELHAVLRALVAEECLVDERLVREIPGVSMDFVQVTEAGEESPALGHESRGQRQSCERTPPPPRSRLRR